MLITVGKKNAVEIDDDVFKTILNFYPEERLHEAPFFSNCFQSGVVSYSNLCDEAKKIFLPWQLFFLNKSNLKKQLAHIAKQREDKLSGTFFTKRKGSGKHTSRRIIDRLIRVQNFVITNGNFSKNNFCRALSGMETSIGAEFLLNYFGIDMDYVRNRRTKNEALEYIIGQVEIGHINVSRGVRALLPVAHGIDKVYKNTSGFVLRDSQLPFLFLPGDINPEEATGRQIYSIFYLLASIGLDDYNFFIDQDLVGEVIAAKNVEQWKHALVSHILFPPADTERLNLADIDMDVINIFSRLLKITPTAVLVILRMRKVVDQPTFENLNNQLKSARVASVKNYARNPKISNSVKKFCGTEPSNILSRLIKDKKIKSITAQHLLFGRVNKKQYKKYLSEIAYI